MKLKIKKDATVEVITGNDKGKQGQVLDIDKRAMRIKVKGVKMMTHFDRENGLEKKEGYIDYSNVKLISNPTEKKKIAKKRAK
tara:strand:+ start:514 stop:762 length:249 start_codon:yes stop_codon:yes gene_type:complete